MEVISPPAAGLSASNGAAASVPGLAERYRFVRRWGSCATPGTHIRARCCDFFPPEATWQFSGLRPARDVR